MTKNRTIRKRRTIHIIDDNSGKKTFYRYVRSPKKVTCKRKKKRVFYLCNSYAGAYWPLRVTPMGALLPAGVGDPLRQCRGRSSRKSDEQNRKKIIRILTNNRRPVRHRCGALIQMNGQGVHRCMVGISANRCILASNYISQRPFVFAHHFC